MARDAALSAAECRAVFARRPRYHCMRAGGRAAPVDWAQMWRRMHRFIIVKCTPENVRRAYFICAKRTFGKCTLGGGEMYARRTFFLRTRTTKFADFGKQKRRIAILCLKKMSVREPA